MDGGEELAGVASGKVGAAYGASEEGVSGQEEVLGREVKADRAFGVAGRVKDVAGEAGSAAFGCGTDGDEFAVFESVVGFADGWGGDA